MIAIDLFSGCGGLTLGLKMAGFEVLAAVEVDPLSVETYQKNHGEVSVWERDIRQLKVSEVKKRLGLWKGELDLLAGCPPCQGFSSIRTLNGARSISDPRNDLIFEYLRFVEELKPKAIMFENVPGLITDERMIFLRKRLKKLGYNGDSGVLNVANFGVPQRRRRMILLGGRFFYLKFPPADSRRKTVRDAIAFLPPPGRSDDPLHDFPEKRTPRILEMIKNIPKNGGSRSDLGLDNQLACHKKCNGFKDVYGRIAWDDVAPTITGGCVNPSKGRFLHPEQDRAITLREAALLQSFPLDYHFSLRRGKLPAAAMIGNSLPPEFIRKISCAIEHELQGKI
jgi:DNA (cytosine-5)-methyltransferase 1